MPTPARIVAAPPDAPPARGRRAAALPPEERRAAIIGATVPLLFLHGAAVTTRLIAEAAGIAEGTIFRVFPDKDALIQAAVEKALDPAPVEAAIAAIDPHLTFEDRLIAAVEILQARVATVWQLMTNVGFMKTPGDQESPATRNATDLSSLAAIFESAGDRLDRDPVEAARILRALTIAGSHPALATDGMLSPADIVGILLDGIRTSAPTTSPAAPKDSAC